MNAVQCPHCQSINEIDGAKPGQVVQCIRCDGSFTFGTAAPSTPQRWSHPADAPPVAATRSSNDPIASALVAVMREAVAELKLANENVTALAERFQRVPRWVQNISQCVVFFAIVLIVSIGLSVAGFLWAAAHWSAQERALQRVLDDSRAKAAETQRDVDRFNANLRKFEQSALDGR